MQTYIGLDFGTTHVKAGLFDGDGTLLQLERVPTPTQPDPLGPVYDPREVEALLEELLGRLRLPSTRPRGIVVTGMAEAGLALEKASGSPLSPIIPWYDRRTLSYAQRLSPEADRERFCTTGLRNSFKYGIYKYRWVLDHGNHRAEGTVWLSAVDYVVYLLTGQMVTEPTFAARTYAYHLETGDFDLAFLEKWGLSRENFPRIIPSGAAAGSCCLPGWEGVPVCIGAHDHVCAAFGMALAAGQGICDSCGTAETYLGQLAQRPLTQQDFDTGCCFGPFPGGGLFWMGNISASGLSVEWYRTKGSGPLSYETLNAYLEENREPTGILYFPALTGMGTPCCRQTFPAAFLGLEPRHDHRDMLRAVVEGLGYQGRLVLEAAGAPELPVLSVGGATESPGWMQRKADILGRQVLTLAQKEATLSGAVTLMVFCQQGGPEAGRFARGMTLGARYTPDPWRQALYEEGYRRYCHWYRVILGGLEKE